MKQFDVHENIDPDEREHAPYWVVLQSDLLKETNARVVAPLVRMEQKDIVQRLDPVFEVAGETLALSMLEVTSMHRRWLGKTVANLESQRDKIIGAVDMLFTGI